MTVTGRIRTENLVSSDTPATVGVGRTVFTLAAGAVVAVAANEVIALSATAAGASAAFSPLAIAVFAPFTVVALLAAYLGWRAIARRSTRPAAVLRVVVPVLAVLSYVPDAVLLATGFIPHTSLTAVVGLALMHLVVVAVAVPICRRLVPVR